jgi:hypothetical protein
VKRRAFILAVILSSSCAGLWLGAPLLTGGDQIKAPHARHAAAKVDCLTCHETAYDSKQLGERVSAEEKTCLQCHKDRKDDCAMCHTKVRQRQAGAPRPEPRLIMSHAAHIERTKEDCKVCHTKLPEPVRTQEMVPAMQLCLNCHEHKKDFDDGKCARCHTDLQRYQLKPISRYTHGGNFVREHMRPARAAPNTCATCHDQTFCADCHAATVGPRIEVKQPDRVDRDFIHRNDFVSRHAIESQADRASCRRCHGTSFCDNCHQAQALTPQAVAPRNPHPPGWSLPGSAEFHGTEARRDIGRCAACHDQGAASNCVSCHRVGGVGGNPHPVGFTDKHGREEIQTNNMCRYCHL